MSGKSPTIKISDLSGAKAAIISARWHSEICDQLVAGATRAVKEANIQSIDLHEVPGSFELPLAAKLALTNGADFAVVLGVVLRGEERLDAVVGEVGSRRPQLIARLEAMPGVASATPISRPFKLASREFHPEDTVIRVLDAVIGDGSLSVMAGPCSVEGRDQLLETALAVKAEIGRAHV